MRAFSRSLHRCGSCTRESCRCSRHSQDVSLSLWQCSDRATHLSTDALPVPRVERGGGEVGRGGVVASRISPSCLLSFAHSTLFARSSPSCRARRFFSFARSPPRSLYSTLRVSLRLEPHRTSHPAPREPIPTHVEAPTRDAGDDLRSRPNVPEPPPPLRVTTAARCYPLSLVLAFVLSRAIVYNDRDPPPARCRP